MDKNGDNTFTEQTAEEFRTAYKQALKDNKEMFMFQDRLVLTKYAGYLCEYLTNQGLMK